jgi:hypothetical protein
MRCEHKFKVKNVVFWDVALCRSWVNRRFGGTYRLHHQGRKICERELTSAGGCRLSHQSETINYIRIEREVTWKINREERGRVWVKVSKQVAEGCL